MLDYNTMKIEDIIEWCKEHGEVAWLKKTAAKKVDYKVYPRVKGEDGKVRADKTATPKIEKRPISFIQIKIEFVDKFMPEIKPEKKEPKQSMYDIIKAL